MLEIKNLHAAADGNEILRGIDLTVGVGEVHAIMGPNGSGKSTLAQVLAGNPAFTVTAGAVSYDGKDLLALKPEERAREGLFLAFQYPVEVRGITNSYFLRSAVNAIRKHRGQEELDPLALDLLPPGDLLPDVSAARLDHALPGAGLEERRVPLGRRLLPGGEAHEEYQDETAHTPRIGRGGGPP